MATKYVRTQKGVICFPPVFSHDEFKCFDPTSAGFINFRTEIKDGKEIQTAQCYGESVSLGMASHPSDSMVATFQLFKLGI